MMKVGRKLKNPSFGAMVGLAVLIALCATCAGSGTKESGYRTAEPTVVELITAENGRLGWAGLMIGMTREEVERVLNRHITLYEAPSPSCGEVFADISFQGRIVPLQFSGDQAKSVLESIFVRFSGHEAERSREELVSDLKGHISDLIYQPSRHDPDLKESDNPTPVYLLPSNRELAILLKPGTGFYLSLVGCLD